jgi:hypothetical protein
MEHVVLSHLWAHLDRHDIILKHQHGFRSGLSCTSQLIEALHDWSRSIDNKRQTDLILLDFSKAFDKVPHHRLSLKLDYYGIRNNTLSWIKAFLQNRTQRVSVNGSLSDIAAVTSGVPQGSVLGPVLFLLYINDISENIRSSLRLFADDSILYREIKNGSDHTILQQDLVTLAKWSQTWQMEFNIDKCYLMTISTKPSIKQYTYSMFEKALQRERAQKYLGITINDKLGWKDHVNKTVASACKTMGLIRRTLHPCTQEVKSRAYKAMVLPKLEYASEAWSPHVMAHIKKLESVQRSAARFVRNDYRRTTSVTGLLNDLKWDTLQRRRLVGQLTFLHKIKLNLVHIPIPPYFKPPTVCTRSNDPNKFTQPQTRTNIYQFSFFPRAIRVWNTLPPNVILLTESHQFQKAVNSLPLTPPPHLALF